jgi:hypothetical protein
MSFLMLVALATLIYAGVWMAAAPSRALVALKTFSDRIRQFDGVIQVPGVEAIQESTPVRTALRFLGLALILLSVIRLTELA